LVSLLTKNQLEKIFDIGCCLVDVLQLSKSMQPARRPSVVDLGPKESLVEFLKLCGTVKWGSTRYLPLLESKIEEYKYAAPVTAIDNSLRSNGTIVEEALPLLTPIQTDNVNEAMSNLNFDPQMWDVQAMGELNQYWLESLSDPASLDPTQIPDWEMFPSSIEWKGFTEG
jgi:hypothetical protein